MNEIIEMLMTVGYEFAAQGLCLIGLTGFVITADPLQCPRGWHHDGISRAGQFDCTHDHIDDLDWDGMHDYVVPMGRIRGQMCCTSGAHAIVVDRRSVGCQR